MIICIFSSICVANKNLVDKDCVYSNIYLIFYIPILQNWFNSIVSKILTKEVGFQVSLQSDLLEYLYVVVFYSFLSLDRE